MDLDAVEIFAADDLHANNMTVASRNKFLHQGCVIEAEVERVCVCSGFQLIEAVEAGNASSAAADIWFYDNGKAQPVSRLNGIGRAVDDASLRIGEAERFQQCELKGF